MLKGFSDRLTTPRIDLRLKMPVLTLINLGIQFFLLNLCLLVKSGKVIELVLIGVSILRDEVATVLRLGYTRFIWGLKVHYLI